MRAVLVLALLVPVVAVSTGCGASLSAIANAATKSNSQVSEHVAITSATTAGGDSFTIQGDGDFQNAPALGAMNLTVHEGGKTLTTHEVLHGTTVYLSSEAFTSMLPNGKTWVSFDYAARAEKLGFNVTSLMSQSPTNTLQQLEKSSHVSKVGTETIDGVQTTHYTATLDSASAKKIANVLKGSVSMKPIDVWIDGNGLVRREHVVYSTTLEGTAISNETTVDLSNYGEQVSVQVPSTSETLSGTTPIASGGSNP